MDITVKFTVEQYQEYLTNKTLINVIRSLLESCQNSVDFETAVRHILQKERESEV